jgi:hypothetical protein
MKNLIIIALSMVGIASPLIAEARPTQTKIDITYENVDAKWFADLDSRTKAVLEKKGGVVAAPSVTAKSGQSVTMEVIHEYRTRQSTSSNTVVACGIILGLTPELNGEVIRLVGTSVLRRSTDNDKSNVATRFEAQELLVDIDLKDGESKVLELEDGGLIRLTATIIDATGRPIKK